MTPSPKAATLALALMAATAVAGCTLNRSSLRQTGETLLNQIGGDNARVIEPKRCALAVWMVSKPLGDRAVNDAVWSTADEQGIPPDARRELTANGLRVGILTGGLPVELEAAINPPPPKQVRPVQFNLPDGNHTLISLAESLPNASLLITRDGHAVGKDYKDASGFFRATATQESATGVTLRLVPEIHHGPLARRYDAVPNPNNTFNTMEFGIKDGQQEETLRELAATLTLQPGQYAVIGSLPDRRGSLGAFLFTQAESNSDRLLQKVVLIQATRTGTATVIDQPNSVAKLAPVDPADLPALPLPSASPKNALAAKPENSDPKNSDASKD